MKPDHDPVREILLAVEANKNHIKEGIDLVLENVRPERSHTMCYC